MTSTDQKLLKKVAPFPGEISLDLWRAKYGLLLPLVMVAKG